MHADLQTVLRAGAEELADLALVADQLGAVGIADVERWQSLDRMSQHLAGMAAFLSALSAAVPDTSLDVSRAMDRLTTSALADRLAGRACEEAADAGALELFGA